MVGQAPDGSSPTKGQLVIIGGAEDRDGECTILREFVRRAGGIQSRIAVFTAATRMPREVGEDYRRIFERLGSERVDIVDYSSREDADREEFIEIVKGATGVFFTGGDQARIIDLTKDTKLDEIMRQRYLNDGLVIGGTSAGAAMMPETMIVEGDSQSTPRVNVVDMGPGMGFLPGVVVDQHFAQRGRLGRLLSALVQQPAMLGVGIDENTAIIVHDDMFEVVGHGSITVVDETESTHNNLEDLLKDEALAVCGVKLHILPNGYRFNLKTRKTELEPALV